MNIMAISTDKVLTIGASEYIAITGKEAEVAVAFRASLSATIERYEEDDFETAKTRNFYSGTALIPRKT